MDKEKHAIQRKFLNFRRNIKRKDILPDFSNTEGNAALVGFTDLSGRNPRIGSKIDRIEEEVGEVQDSNLESSSRLV